MTRHQNFSPLLICYVIMGAFSIIGSSFVAITLARFGSLKTVFTRLMFLLHVSLIAEEFTIIPFIYDYSIITCTFNEWMHFYSGLMNAVIIMMLVLSYRYLFFEDTYHINWFVQKYGVWFVCLFPLITLLPFSSKEYYRDNREFCTPSISRSNSNLWAIFAFFIWAWLALAVSTVGLADTLFRVYRTDQAMGRKIMSTVGMYNIASIVCWLPRSLFRLSQLTTGHVHEQRGLIFAAYMPVYFAGLMYTLIFFREKKALALFVNYTVGAAHSETDSLHSRDDSHRGDFSFSWENWSDGSFLDHHHHHHTHDRDTQHSSLESGTSANSPKGLELALGSQDIRVSSQRDPSVRNTIGSSISSGHGSAGYSHSSSTVTGAGSLGKTNKSVDSKRPADTIGDVTTTLNPILLGGGPTNSQESHAAPVEAGPQQQQQEQESPSTDAHASEDSSSKQQA